MPKKEAKKNEENSLIERSKQGEYSAFRQLVEQYQSRIYAVCYGVVRNREDALDVMQEVFIKIYHSIKKFHGESGLYSWIYRIAVNASLDFLRKQKRKRKFFETAYQERDVQIKGANTETPGDIVITLELKEVVHQAINKLPEKHKAIIILREIEGLSYQEIAKIMKCSEGTVMSRLFYARKKLTSLLKNYIKINGENDEV